MIVRTAAASIFALMALLPQASAQPPQGGAAQRAAMQKLNFWVGRWKGTSQSQFGDQRRESTIEETVEAKLGGTVLLVEGLGKSTIDGKQAVTHNALAVISFDEKSKTYRFRHYTMQGRSGEAELKTIDGGFQWELKEEGSPVVIRFTIKVDEKKWHEVGEFSRTGQAWQKFLEMSLEKQP